MWPKPRDFCKWNLTHNCDACLAFLLINRGHIRGQAPLCKNGSWLNLFGSFCLSFCLTVCLYDNRTWSAPGSSLWQSEHWECWKFLCVVEVTMRQICVPVWGQPCSGRYRGSVWRTWAMVLDRDTLHRVRETDRNKVLRILFYTNASCISEGKTSILLKLIATISWLKLDEVYLVLRKLAFCCFII